MADTNLEKVIRDLAARGELNHISLVPSQKGKKFRAAFSMCSMFGSSFGEDEDPVKAIILACTMAKMKPQRKMKRSELIELTAHEVTPEPDAHNADDLM